MFKFNKLFCSILFTIFLFCSQYTKVQAEEFYGIGAKILKDTNSNKTFIVGILNATPAQRANLKPGDEITRIDGKSIKKLSICEIVSKIRGVQNTKVVLTIKKGFFKRERVELTRQKIINNIYYNEQMNSHWVQISTPCYLNPELYPKEVIDKLSRKYKKTTLAKEEYWYNRKQGFIAGFNVCKNYSDKDNQELCLIHLMDRESAKTNIDKMLYKFLR